MQGFIWLSASKLTGFRPKRLPAAFKVLLWLRLRFSFCKTICIDGSECVCQCLPCSKLMRKDGSTGCFLNQNSAKDQSWSVLQMVHIVAYFNVLGELRFITGVGWFVSGECLEYQECVFAFDTWTPPLITCNIEIMKCETGGCCLQILTLMYVFPFQCGGSSHILYQC